MLLRSDIRALADPPNFRNFSPALGIERAGHVLSRRVDTCDTAANRQICGVPGPTRSQRLGRCEMHSSVRT